MSSGGWLPPQEEPQVAAAQEFQGFQPEARIAAYELRPLSLGEVLDRTFAVYRAHFWLFAGIASLSGAVQLIANMIQLLVYRGVVIRPGFVGVAALERQAGGAVTGLLFFMATAVTQAATVWALSEVYLGRQATIAASMRAVIGKWLRYIGIALWQAWSLLWLPMLVMIPGVVLLVLGKTRLGTGVTAVGGVLIFLGATAGLAFGVIFFLRNMLGVQAAVVERLKVCTAMRRSKVLSSGAKGRIFVVLLIAWCLFMVAAVVEMPMAFIIGFGALRGERHILAQAGVLVVNFVAHTLVSPVALIGLSLVYFDQRVRQEALDLLLMLGGGAEAGPAAGGAETATLGRPTEESGPANDAASV